MGTGSPDLPELRDLGKHLLFARIERGLSQSRLAAECRLSQAQVSLFEAGRRLPSLDQFVRLARALDVPLQRLLGGDDRPGVELKDLVVELRRLGAVDLWVADAAVPGAARRPEEVIALAASGSRPEPRVVETLPALLSWNEIDPAILAAHGAATKTTHRLGWLADVALAVDRRAGFPGGCRRDPLERFIAEVALPPVCAPWDDLGWPSEVTPASPVWRRWKIRYATNLECILQRSTSLAENRAWTEQLANIARRARPVVIGRREKESNEVWADDER